MYGWLIGSSSESVLLMKLISVLVVGVGDFLKKIPIVTSDEDISPSGGNNRCVLLYNCH